MDVVDDASLFLEGALDWLGVRGGFLESLTKFFVGLLKTLADGGGSRRRPRRR